MLFGREMSLLLLQDVVVVRGTARLGLVNQESPQQFVAPTLLLKELCIVVNVGDEREDQVKVALAELFFLKVYNYLDVVFIDRLKE